MVRKLAELSWAQVADMGVDDAILILPISALEQHGHHLPFGTDNYLLQMVLDEIYDNDQVKSEFLCLPTIAYGASLEHVRFAGTMALSLTTIISIISDIARCMKSQGFKKLVIINSHGGNNPILKAIPVEMEEKFSVRVFNINLLGSGVYSTAGDILQGGLDIDIHGGESETSLMMHGYPQYVNESKISQENDEVINLTNYYNGWFSDELSENNGVMGKATLGSKQKGEKLLKHAVNSVVELLDSIAKYG